MTSQSFIVGRKEQLPHLIREIERRLEGGPVRVTVGAKPSRSREQLAYLHVAIRQLAAHTGTGESELKEFLKSEYGPETVVRVGNRAGVIRKSVGDYTQDEAAAMIEHVERIAAECGLLLAPTGSGQW